MERILKICLLSGIIVFAFISLLKPVDDPDFWWHLKTGEYIARNGLPDRDPFAFTNPVVPEPRERVILTGYWLPQLLYHWTYEAVGFKGVILLRVLLVGLMYWSVVSRTTKAGVDKTAMFVAVGLSLLSFTTLVTPDRPQTFSFLFFSILMGMMESAGRGMRPSRLLVPLMVLWANCHGGVIMGAASLALFALSSLVEQRAEPKKALSIILWALSGIAASLANPNTYHLYAIAFGVTKGGFSQFIVEYQSSYAAFVRYGSVTILYYWVLLALVACVPLAGGGRPLWQSLVVTFIGGMSFAFVRNIAFLSVGLAPQAARCVGMALKFIDARRVPAVLIRAAVTVLLLGSFMYHAKEAFREGSLRAEVNEYYPAGAADFIRSSGLSGRMFNEYGWGGYLIWRLYPDHKVFIDGRGIYEAVFSQSVAISAGGTERVAGLPAWKAYLKAYDVDFVVLPLYNIFSGQLQPLMLHLLKEDDWWPVYVDTRAFIFVRHTEQNRPVIERYGGTRQSFIKMLLMSLQYRAERREDHRLYIAMGEALWYMGRHAEAEQAYLKALRLSPANRTALYDLRILRESFRGGSGG